MNTKHRIIETEASVDERTIERIVRSISADLTYKSLVTGISQ